MLTRVIEAIADGKDTGRAPSSAMIKLGVAQAAGDREGQHGPQPHVAVRVHGQQVRVPRRGLVAVDRVPDRAAQRRGRRGDRRDHGRSSRAELKETKTVDDAVLKVVRESFKETSADPLRGQQLLGRVGEGGRRSAACPTCAERRRRSAQLVTTERARAADVARRSSREEELESRYHVRLERYIKDMLIEVEALKNLVSGHVLPAAFKQLALLSKAGSGKTIRSTAERVEASIEALNYAGAGPASGGGRRRAARATS